MKKNIQSSNTILKSQRRKIDRLDLLLLKTLNERATLINQIKVIKKELGMAVYDRRRESEIIEGLITKNDGPLRADEIRLIFKTLFQIFRKRQRLSNDGLQKRR
jgi:chorismate mutase